MGQAALPVTFACVLKTGAWNNRAKVIEYRAEHVQWLQQQVHRFYPHSHRFVCLSDIEVKGVDGITLEHDWPGWWSKIELFRPGLFIGKVFYIDLDTVLVDDITELVDHSHRFTTLKNLTKLEDNNPRIGSGVMCWDAGKGFGDIVYDTFTEKPEYYIANYNTTRRWGDQGFIQDTLQKWDYFQDQFPGAIQSYKFHLQDKNRLPEGCKIVCFHGKPKPWEVRHDWIPYSA